MGAKKSAKGGMAKNSGKKITLTNKFKVGARLTGKVKRQRRRTVRRSAV